MKAKPIVSLLVCFGAALCTLSDAQARRIVTFDRFLGLVSIGGSVFLASEAYDYRQKADDLYDEYEAATTSALAEQLYEDVTRNDVKSGLHVAASVCLAINGLRLLFSPGEPELEDLYGDAAPLKRKDLALELRPDPQGHQLGLVLIKRL
jgi:hypothetical protein